MTDSRIKILVSFFLILALTMMRHWYFPIAVSALCILFAARFHMIGDYSRKLIFPVIMALFIFAIQSLTKGAATKDFMGIIPLHPEGIAYGFLIFSRVLASASVLVLLVLTTSGNEMLESMRSLGIPGTMLEISSFMGRYIKAFSIEGKKMKLAQESRCSSSKGFPGRMQNIASISGALIVRAFARSEEVYRAMVSRAWVPGNSGYATGIRQLNRNEILIGITLSFGIFAMLGFDVLL